MLQPTVSIEIITTITPMPVGRDKKNSCNFVLSRLLIFLTVYLHRASRDATVKTTSFPSQVNRDHEFSIQNSCPADTIPNNVRKIHAAYVEPSVKSNKQCNLISISDSKYLFSHTYFFRIEWCINPRFQIADVTKVCDK